MITRGTIATSMILSLAMFAGCKDKAPEQTTTAPEAAASIVTTTSTTDAAAAASPVERGAYLVGSVGCHDCHTPMKMGPNGPEPDMSRALSGHPADMQLPPPPKPVGPWVVSAAPLTAWSGPWGISYSANITSDKETGIGKWTRQNFIDTIKNGRHMGNGREILPPMPIPAFKNMTENDLGAIYEYLMTVTPVSNKVPEPKPPAGPPPGAAPKK